VATGGDVALVHTTILDNLSPVAGNIGAGGRLDAFASIIGPTRIAPSGGLAQPTETNCRAAGGSRSFGWNFVFDRSCGLAGPADITATGDPKLGPLRENGGFGETRVPVVASPVVDRIPAAQCRFRGLPDPLAMNARTEFLAAGSAARAAHDQRGAPRPLGAACDIGAVEAR
jgi:hypothetical protein